MDFSYPIAEDSFENLDSNNIKSNKSSKGQS